MKNAVWIWIVRVISLFVLGPIAGGVMSSLRGVDGSVHATAFLSGSLLSGAFALLVVFFLAMLGGMVATRAVSLREGVLNAGMVIAWGAWGSGSVAEALRVRHGTESLIVLAVEGVVVVILSVLILLILSLVGGRCDSHDECVRVGMSDLKGISGKIPQSGALAGVGLAVSVLIVWLQVQNGLSGQSVWGGFIGAVVAGFAGGMVIKNHSLKKGGGDGDDLSLIPGMLGVLMGAVIGPVITMFMPGSGHVLDSIAGGDAPGWMMMSSLAWSGGALIGTPIGYSWVESSVARQHVQSAAA